MLIGFHDLAFSLQLYLEGFHTGGIMTMVASAGN